MRKAARVAPNTVEAFLSQAELELRTPLALIQGYIETLKSGVVRGAEQFGRCLEIMDKHSRRLMHVVEDMNAVAGLGREGVIHICYTVLMQQNIEVAVEQLTPSLQAQGVLVEYFVQPGGRCRMRLDRGLWHLLLVKLLQALIGGRTTQHRIRLEVRWKEAEVILSAVKAPLEQPADCAAGASPSTVEHTYGELELLVVKRAVEVHGGTFEIRPCGDEGDCITLSLPCEA